MNDDEKFDRELRATLDGLAREPAPDRLVDRVAEIPSREPATRTRGFHFRMSAPGFASGFGLLAVAVAIAVLTVVIRPGVGPSSTVGGSPSPATSSSGPASTASESSVPASTPAPTSTATPTQEASTVPAGFSPMSATFVSADTGWVLGSVPCDQFGRCPAIVRTDDGGATWRSIPAPNTAVGRASGGDQVTPKGVSSIRFADPSNGWVFGPELWATHDGGATWTLLAIGGLPRSAPVLALETAAGSVHAVLYGGAQDFSIASSRFDADDWHVSDTTVQVGAGPVPELRLVLSGSAGWVVENDRVVAGGAILTAGAWKPWQPPCGAGPTGSDGSAGPVFLGASSSRNLVAVCDIGVFSTPTGEHLFTSTDGGATFSETGTRTPLSTATSAASPDQATILVAGFNDTGARIVASFDRGKTWSTVVGAPAESFADLGFTTRTQGIVIAVDGSGVGHFLMTHDAGKTWSPVTF